LQNSLELNNLVVVRRLFACAEGLFFYPDDLSKYPFTATLYAITVKDNKKMRTIQPFLEWMQGPQGQELVEEVGYIKVGKE